MRVFLRDVIAVWAVTALLLGGLGTVFVLSSADAVYAKHGKNDRDGERGGGRKGGDRDKGDRDKGDRKGGDRDKGERHGKKGKGGKHNKHHAGGKYKDKHDGWHGKKYGKHKGWKGKKYGKHKGWKGKKYGKYRDDYKGWKSKKYYGKKKGWKDFDRRDFGRWGRAAFADMERDIRRAFGREDRRARYYGSRDGFRPKQRVRKMERSIRPKMRRDPLVAAITSPDGSDKLRNLNAAKANYNAFRNASPNSNVGKIAAYQASAEDYYTSRERLQRRKARLKNLDENYTGRSSGDVLGDIADLDPDSPTFEQDLDKLENELSDAQSYEQRRDALSKSISVAKKDVVENLQQAEADFFDASKGREVTKQTLGQLHRILGLPKPVDRPKGDKPTEQVASAD